MRIELVDDAIEDCERHLAHREPVDEEITSMLTRALLILIYAEFEKRLRELVIERCSVVHDEAVKEYLKNRTRIRSLKVSDMTRLVGEFGDAHREEFRQLLQDNARAEFLYESIRSNRNSIAHGQSCNATFGDVKQYYEGGHEILDYFRLAVWRGIA